MANELKRWRKRSRVTKGQSFSEHFVKLVLKGIKNRHRRLVNANVMD